MATATTILPLETEGMERNTMEALAEPEPSTLTSDSNPESLNAVLDSQASSPKDASKGATDVTDGATIESTTSASSAAPNNHNPENHNSTASSLNEETPDATTADATAEATAAEGDEDEEDFKIPFEPGDHITRWEMLPIAWPIQVHGIVLEVHEDAVVLVDFGLAAVPEGKNHKNNRKKRGLFGRRQKQTEEAVEESESSNANAVDESERSEDGSGETKKDDGSAAENKEEEEKKQQYQHAKKAIENFQKGFKKERNRLNVQTLTTKKEISKWSKVNYDGGLFGFGNNKDSENNKGDNKNGDNGNNKSSNPKRLEKKESWWGNLIKNQEKKKAEREQRKKEESTKHGETDTFNAPSSDDTTPMTPNEVKSVESVDSAATPTNVPGCGGMPGCAESGNPWWSRLSMQRGKKLDGKDASAAMLKASKNGDLVQEFKKKNKLNDDNLDFLGELEKRQMRKSLQQQHSDYMESLPDGVGDEAASAVSPKRENVEETADETNEESPKAEIISTDETTDTAMFEEEKKDEHDTSYESSPKEKESPQLSVITDSEMFTADTSTSLESPTDTSQASNSSPTAVSPSSNGEESLESSDSASTKSESNSDNKKKRKHIISKADPPLVVLARTRWLLKHGEGILPPYHAFSSNSECIAVFCKTGYWSTLQADIFLHSTAIGNAKSATLSTLAVAASVPMLAPVVGVVGLGAVVAPWFYLDKQKKAARETQQRLADQFWAQAEPEVIVACVKAWSHLEDDEQEEEATLLEETASTTSQHGAVEESLLQVDETGATGENSN